jgi:hypothetical protein
MMEPKLIYRLAGGGVGFGIFFLLLSAFSGGGTATVTGHVTLGGRPIIWGSVVLVGEDGRSAAGRIQPDGSFTIANAPTGEVVATISSPDPLVQHYATQLKASRERLPVTQWAAPPVDRQQWFVLPKKYESALTSDLKVVVKRGDNPCDLTLTP